MVKNEEEGLRVVIDWCSLVPTERDFVRQSLWMFGEQLAERYPTLPRVGFRELSDDERERVGGYLVRKIQGASASTRDPFDDRLVFVFSSRDHEVALALRQKNSMAMWGGAELGCYAVVWEPGNSFVLWHETMHLLNAHDCYDETGRTTCSESRCLMQWEPSEVNCGGSLVLCAANVKMVAANAEIWQPGGVAPRPLAHHLAF